MFDSACSGDFFVIEWDIDLLVSSYSNVFVFAKVTFSDCDKVYISVFWLWFLLLLFSGSVADKFFSSSDNAVHNSERLLLELKLIFFCPGLFAARRKLSYFRFCVYISINSKQNKYLSSFSNFWIDSESLNEINISWYQNIKSLKIRQHITWEKKELGMFI